MAESEDEIAESDEIRIQTISNTESADAEIEVKKAKKSEDIKKVVKF